MPSARRAVLPFIFVLCATVYVWAATGRVVFETRLPGLVSGVPITYAAAGRQYMAVPVGGAAGSTAMFVYALPKAAATRSQ